jgi:hypothetical protein
MYNDPLILVNSKKVCPACNGEKPAIKHCRTCKKHGFLPTDLNGLWSAPGFLVCGGPSINKLPFHKLSERGIVSMAINNSAGHVPVSAWVFSDPQEKFHHGLYLDPKIMTFAPISKLNKKYRIKEGNEFKWSDDMVKDCPNTFGFSRKTELYPEKFLTTDFAQWGYGGKQPSEKPFECLCTMLLGIRLMCYLGCPRIYLLGVDFLRTEIEQYSFAQKANPSSRRYAHENAMLQSIRPYIEQMGVEIYNCNIESQCNAFDFVTFEDAFEDCKGMVREPFDLSGWYEKEEEDRKRKELEKAQKEQAQNSK